MSGFIGGLDIGQVQDPAALAVLRKDGEGDKAMYALLVLERFELGTKYPDLLRQVGVKMATPPLKGSALVFDKTGVGAGVYDLALERLTETPVYGVVVTAGHKATKQDDGVYHVPKKDLVGAALLLLQSRRLQFAPGLRFATLLHKELQNFQMKITTAGNETFGNWREGQHDDLVFAVALACWIGENIFTGPWDATPDAAARLEVFKAPPGVFNTPDRDSIDERDDPDGDDDPGFGMIIPPAW